MRGDLVTKAEIKSLSGTERLRLIYAEAESDGLDFHSLALETLEQEGWKAIRVITQDQFQGQNQRRRWISDLHSFSPSNERAIVQIAEGDRPQGSFVVSYVYSWRRWNLAENSELALLKVCQSPFDPL